MISVDQNKCIGCGLCAGMCPEVFQMNADGKSEVIAQADKPCAQNAAASCPVSPEQFNVGKKIESSLEVTTEKPELKNESPKKPGSVKEPVLTPSKLVNDAATVLSDDYHRQREQAIENILADGMDQIFLKMNPQEQVAFKLEGERAATKINQLLDKAKVGVGKVISVILRWLGLIPNANKFYLEQEAKIKADKILKIKNNL